MGRIRLDVNGFFDHMIGGRGFVRADVEAIDERVAIVSTGLEEARARGELPFYDLPYEESLRQKVGKEAARVQSEFSRCVVLGIGGSALGARAVLDAIPRTQRRRGIEVEVVDNIDPATMTELLARIDLDRTVFNVISKSGTTVETMSQLLVVHEVLIERFGKKGAAKRLLFTTDAETGVLRAIAEAEGVATLTVPAGVGGRFSVLSAVGLFPVAVAGVDIEALHRGARRADDRCRATAIWENPAALHAALLFLALQEHGQTIHVMMPYKDSLLGLAEWYGQLWAESLGKRRALDASIVETGQTPVRALGATDQHSQVQLYAEGPRDKVVTFIRLEQHDPDIVVPLGFEDQEAISYLGGHSLGDILNMEQRATELALVRSQRPTSVISIETLDAEAIGFLFHMFEVQTLMMGGLLAVDPLDQPGVEAGKVLTQAMAGCDGFEGEAEEVRRWFSRKRRDLVVG